MIKRYTDSCNQSKKELDNIKSRLDAKAEEKRVTMRQDMLDYQDDDEAEATGAQEIIDEEELGLIQKMKETKKVYRDNFEKLRETKGQVFYIQQSIDTLK